MKIEHKLSFGLKKKPKFQNLLSFHNEFFFLENELQYQSVQFSKVQLLIHKFTFKHQNYNSLVHTKNQFQMSYFYLSPLLWQVPHLIEEKSSAMYCLLHRKRFVVVFHPKKSEMKNERVHPKGDKCPTTCVSLIRFDLQFRIIEMLLCFFMSTFSFCLDTCFAQRTPPRNGLLAIGTTKDYKIVLDLQRVVRK